MRSLVLGRQQLRRRSRPAQTLATAFDPRHNSLNALRLALATLVIVSHAWPIGGFGNDPHIGDLSFGGWAVAGFFAISGFLITSSRLRSSFSAYLWRRMLRIFPGLWVCLLVTVLLFVPLAALVEDGADGLGAGSLLSYLAANGILESSHQGIGNTLDGSPYPSAWNGSLWTLWFEFGCYLVLGGLMIFSRLRRPGVLVGLFAGCVVLNVAQAEFGLNLPFRIEWAVDLGSYFFAGAVLCVYANRIAASWSLALASAAVLGVAAMTEHVQAVGALPFAYLLIWLGTASHSRRSDGGTTFRMVCISTRFPSSSCSSSPVRLLSEPGHSRPSVSRARCRSAALSWLLVEEPAMRLKRLTPPWTAMRHRFAPQRQADVPQEAV